MVLLMSSSAEDRTEEPSNGASVQEVESIITVWKLSPYSFHQTKNFNPSLIFHPIYFSHPRFSHPKRRVATFPVRENHPYSGDPPFLWQQQQTKCNQTDKRSSLQIHIASSILCLTSSKFPTHGMANAKSDWMGCQGTQTHIFTRVEACIVYYVLLRKTTFMVSLCCDCIYFTRRLVLGLLLKLKACLITHTLRMTENPLSCPISRVSFLPLIRSFMGNSIGGFIALQRRSMLATLKQ